MRHKVAGWKLGRNTAHRRSLLRNLVTSLIVEERIETTIPKAKAMRPHVEKMITLGKRGDLAARRLAGAYLMTNESVDQAVRHDRSPFWRPQRRLSAHRAHGLAEGRRRREGFRRTAGQRKGARREARKTRRSPRQAGCRSQEGDGRGRCAGASAELHPRPPRSQRKRTKRNSQEFEGEPEDSVSLVTHPILSAEDTHQTFGCALLFGAQW